MHPIFSRLEDFSRWLYQKLMEYRALHANSTPQIIRHVLFGMVLCNIFLFLAVLDRATEIGRNKSFHSSTWEVASSDPSLFLSTMSFIHVMGVWYFLFHPLEPMYLGHYDNHAWNHDSSSSSSLYDPRRQGIFCRRNDLSIGVAVGVTVALGIFLLHVSMRVLWFSGAIRFNSLFLSTMDFSLSYLMVKGKEDFIQTQHVWETHQYQTISDTTLVDEVDNRAVIDTILGYHRNLP